MTTTKQRALRAFRDMMGQKADRQTIWRGILGDTHGTVRLTDRKDRCYVQLRASGQTVAAALSLRVADVAGTPVLLRRTETGRDWEVYDVDYEMLTNTNGGAGWGGLPYGMATHAKTHEWPDGAPGSDPVNVYPRSLSMLRTYRKSTASSLPVRVAPLRYTYGGQLVEFTGADMQLYTYQPVAGYARYVATYLDPISNTMYAHPGAVTIDSAAIVPSVPSLPSFAIPSALVRLSGSKTYLAESDFVDYRLVLDQVQPPVGGADYATSAQSIAQTSSAGAMSPVSRGDHVHDTPLTTRGDLLTTTTYVLTYLTAGSEGSILTTTDALPTGLSWQQANVLGYQVYS